MTTDDHTEPPPTAEPCAEPQNPPLILIATSGDGDIWYDPSTGSTIIPAHW